MNEDIKMCKRKYNLENQHLRRINPSARMLFLRTTISAVNLAITNINLQNINVVIWRNH